MFHPILNSRKKTFRYLTIWVFNGVLQVGILAGFYGVPFYMAMVDSAVFNGVFCLIALGLWFAVRFSNLENQSPVNLILNHLASLGATLFLWLLISYTLVLLLIPTNEVHTNYVNHTLFMRVVSGIGYYSVMVLIYYLILYYNNFQEKITQEADLKALVREAEFSMLKSQINPHFLFNSLNSVSSLTLSNPAKAQEMIIKLSEFLRHSLGEKGKQFSTLGEELARIRLYLDIEKVRFGDRLEYMEDVSIECLELTLPNMILQPLLENAIKHGVHEKTEPVIIRVSCHPGENGIVVLIQNNHDPSMPGKKGAGIGLRNTRQRMAILYGRDDLVKVSPVGDIFEVTLIIPREQGRAIQTKNT